MADNPPPTPAPNPGPRPILPGSTLTGRLKLTATQLASKKAGAGKIVVMLSSVAKPPPMGTQALPRVAPPAPENAPPPSAADPAPAQNLAPPLPPKTVVPSNNLPSPSRPQLSATTYVKLPPKTTTPGWTALSGKPLVPPSAPIASPISQAAPPPLPAMTQEIKAPEPKKSGVQLIPPIKLNEPASRETSAEESIFALREPEPSSKPEAPKDPSPAPPVVLKVPEGPLVSLDLFERAQAAAPAPAPPVAPVEAKGPATPLAAPPLTPPPRFSGRPITTSPLPSVRPPPLPPPVAKPPESKPAPESSRQVAPPLVEKAPEPVVEKLPPPLQAKPVESEAPLSPPLQVAPPMLDPSPEPILEKLPQPLVVKAGETVTLPMVDRGPEPVAEKLPPPLVIKPAESDAPLSAPLHVAPPMLDKAPEPVAEKLPQPHLPVEARKSGGPPPLPPPVPEPPVVVKAPAMVKPEAPPKPLQPPTPSVKTGKGWLRKTTPLVVSSSSQKLAGKPIAEAKPALKPAVLPSRSQPLPHPPSDAPPLPLPEKPGTLGESEAADKGEAKDEKMPGPTAPVPSEKVVPAVLPAVAAVSAKNALPPKGTPTTPPAPDAKAAKPEPVPLTRAERAQRRRFWSTVTFWGLIFPASIAALFFASLHFGRDTRVEGQVIPPPGMTLNNEVWIVTDFRPLATGYAEDLANDRTPLLQEIVERQDHVQRAQADVAAREERIRLLQEEIAAAKSEIDAVVKQSRDDTQKVWDVDGAAIDAEYAARQDQLQKTIADRAKSLNLKYEPDATFRSPEVWANAYRLALYQVPAGVDTVKEHAWLSDQMKAWRDFQKSMDDRTEQLREKAAQIKLGPAPKIADLNAKIDGLQQRIDATQAEEVPLKAELQQAQADLVAVQSAEAGLDDKYYPQLDALPSENIVKRIPLRSNGRFTWIDDDVFVEGEKAHHYWFFARATRPDGRQYWALIHLDLAQFQTQPIIIDPGVFLSTKAILRPNLSPDEQAQ